MSYCINPDCPRRENPDDLEHCQSCGTPLYISDWYKLLQPLRNPDPRHYTEVFEVDDGGITKVMKVLKETSPTLVRQFQREAEALQLFHHPGIPKVESGGYFTLTLDTGRELHCLVMERIQGQNLEQWLAEHDRLPQSLALDWLQQLVEILHVMHSLDFFHRDIKPSNIMLKPDGQLALIDFGAVREITNTYLAKIGTGVGHLGLETRDITIVITTGYAPLEQVNGKPVPQSDFYALGRTFAHLLTGKSLFSLPDDPKTGKLLWHKYAPHIAPPLADFIDQLMAPRVSARPSSTDLILQQLKHRLPRQLRIHRVVSSPWFKLAMTIVVLSGLVGAYAGGRWLLTDYYRRQGDLALLAEAPTTELRRRNAEVARRNYELSLSLNPNKPATHSTLGLACRDLEDYSCAIDHYQQALTLQPGYAPAHYSLGELYVYLGDREQNPQQAQDYRTKAIVQYRLAMIFGTEAAVYAMTDLARLKILAGDNQAALRLTSHALQKVEDDITKAALLNYQGWAKSNQQRFTEAQQDLQQSLLLDPERAGTHCLLGKIYESQQNSQLAREAFRNCLRYPSTLPEVKAWQNELIRRL